MKHVDNEDTVAALQALAGASSIDGAGYDALESRGRRRAPRNRIEHVDSMVSSEQRKQLVATSQDITRNFAVAKWAVQKHLDFVSCFSFHAKTGDDLFDDQLEEFIAERSLRENCDRSRRHPLRRFLRLAEAQRVVAGDVGLLRIADGSLQAIESDRIRNPYHGAPRDLDMTKFVHGVRSGQGGESLAYIICNRVGDFGGGYTYRAVVPARSLYLHAWYDRFDQVRGVSPLTAAISLMQDLHESKDYALAKMKIEQLFGIKFTSRNDDPIGRVTSSTDDDGEPTAPHSIDFDRGAFCLNLDENEDAEIMQGGSPSSQFQEFWKTLVHVALKALDIPYSFFDESFTNFFGSRGSLMQYKKSVRDKVADMQDLLRWWTSWQIELGILDGTLILPRGMTSVRYNWEPDGTPWWDPAKEVRGELMAAAAGLDSLEAIPLRAGTGDIYTNIDINARVMRYAENAGFPLVLPGQSALNPEPQPPKGDS